MKHAIYIAAMLLLLCLFKTGLHAQSQDQPTTLVGQEGLFKEIGFVLAPSYGVTGMDGATASLFGIRGGLLLDKKFAVGAFYNFSLNEIRPQSETAPNVYMDYRAGGGFLEYTIYTDRLIHLTFPLFIGGGEVEMDNEFGNPGMGERAFFLVEPCALLEVNIHKYLRLNLGSGYRFVSGMTYRNLDQRDISGFFGYVGLKIGMF